MLPCKIYKLVLEFEHDLVHVDNINKHLVKLAIVRRESLYTRFFAGNGPYI